jgi:hypothetical protein
VARRCAGIRDTGGKPDAFKLGGPHWLYDLWYFAIQLAESGETHLSLDTAPWLAAMAETQVTMTTRYLYEQYHKHFPVLRPFDFIEMLPALGGMDISQRKMTEALDADFLPSIDGFPERYAGLEYVGFYRSQEGLRRIDTHTVVDLPRETITLPQADGTHAECRVADVEGWSERLAFAPKTLRECLSSYFTHAESKAANPRGIGQLERQHL